MSIAFPLTLAKVWFLSINRFFRPSANRRPNIDAISCDCYKCCTTIHEAIIRQTNFSFCCCAFYSLFVARKDYSVKIRELKFNDTHTRTHVHEKIPASNSQGNFIYPNAVVVYLQSLDHPRPIAAGQLLPFPLESNFFSRTRHEAG